MFKNGGLKINYKVKVKGTSLPSNQMVLLAKNIYFKVNKIERLVDYWGVDNDNGKSKVSTDGKYLEATLEYKALPVSNSSFGKKEVSLVYIDKNTNIEIAKQEYELFFDKFGTDHPNNTDNSENWFYYWSQTPAAQGANLKWEPFVQPYGGAVPAMAFWDYNLTFNGRKYTKDEIWLSKSNITTWIHPLYGTIHKLSAFDEWQSRSAMAQMTKGIDAFANNVAHELMHVNQIRRVDALLTSGKKTSKLWRVGWSFNKLKSYIYFNHVKYGFDGTPGKKGIDDDNDGMIDEEIDNSEIDWNGIDDVVLDINFNNIPDSWENSYPYNVTNNTGSHIGDVTYEVEAWDQEIIMDNTFGRFDWGAPGKNHKTINVHND